VAVEAINLGASAYLFKDERLVETVLSTVEQALEKKRIVDENRALMADISRKNEELSTIIDKMTKVGLAITSEKNFSALMEVIVTHARSLTNADAGTLYLVEDDALAFKIVQNESLGIFLGGTTGQEINFPPVEVTEANVSGYVAIKRQAITIEDVYASELFDFTGPRKFDQSTGYRSRSMLIAPMVDRFNKVVGVLQLLNAIDPETGAVTPFSIAHIEVIQSLASLGAVAVTNLLLEEKTERLLEEVLDVKNYNESILESLSNGVVTIDTDCRISTVNAAARRILCCAADAIIGHPVDRVLTCTTASIKGQIQRAVDSGEPSTVTDSELVVSGGLPIPVNATFVPLHNAKRERIGAMMVF